MTEHTGKIEDIKSLKAVLETYKQDPTKVSFEDWKNIATDFCNLVDKEELPFDMSLSPFCQRLVCKHVDDVEDVCIECELSTGCGYKEEKVSTSFNSFNLGMLYGIALAKILSTEK